MDRDTYLSAELDRLRVDWFAGRWGAIAEALILCDAAARPLPDWATTAALEAIQRVYTLPDGRGRTGNPAARDRQREIHATRWRWCVILLRGGRFAEVEDVFPEVSHMLRGSEAQGAKDAVGASYWIVQRAVDEGRAVEYGIEVQEINSPN